ncbi:MAG: hypothetical protein BGN89_01915 [Alphaproteobacteria bacterium 64-6]|nr:MAG: hypothetical protein BGN89_01915 [Alphaproteobacteria bacterium 64-6]
MLARGAIGLMKAIYCAYDSSSLIAYGLDVDLGPDFGTIRALDARFCTAYRSAGTKHLGHGGLFGRYPPLTREHGISTTVQLVGVPHPWRSSPQSAGAFVEPKNPAIGGARVYCDRQRLQEVLGRDVKAHCAYRKARRMIGAC